MRRKLYKRIVAVTLAAMTIAGSAVFIGRSTRTKAGDGSEIGTSYYDKAMVAEYNDGNIDWVNGERTLQAEDKANVLTNIMKNKQKLTILEIVPYELASVFDILIPDEEQKSTIEAYGDEIFNKFNLPVLSCMREEEPIFTTIRFFSFIRSLMLLIFMFSKFHLLYILHTFVILHHLRQNVTFFLVCGNLLGNF